jgi:CBS domain-containing protein
MANSVSATNTVQRIKLSAPLINMHSAEAAAAIDAFNFIQLMRLRHQHAKREQGREADNRIRPDDLNEVERRILKEAFRQARKLQQRLKLDYQL